MSTNKQKILDVYNFIVEYIENNNYPPSIREICQKLSIKSTSTAYSYVDKLKEQGLLQNSPLKKRALTVSNGKKSFKSIPLIGTVTAGTPVFAFENLEGYCPLPPDFNDSDNFFALRVNGESMIDAGINDKDIVIIKKQEYANNGDIVVALIEDSATVKRFFRKDGKIVLHPENITMNDMIFDDVQILGTVKGLIRKF